MAGLTLDSGALIAVDRRDRRVWSILDSAARREAVITIPAGVLAQTWRGNNIGIARLLKGAEVEPLDHVQAKEIGRALAISKMRDIVDAAVVLGAIRRHDMVLTSDVSDLEMIAEALGQTVALVAV